MKKSKQSYNTDVIDELLLDVLWQACGADEDGMIDNRCLSSYERACAYLCKKGLLVHDSKKSGRIYFLAKNKDLKREMSRERADKGW